MIPKSMPLRRRGWTRFSEKACSCEGGDHAPPIEHDPEKWTPVFGKDHAPPIMQIGITIQRYPALAIALRVEGRGGAAMNERLTKIRRADGEAQLEKLPY